MESTADFELGDVIAPRAAVSIEITSTPGAELRAGAQPRPRRLPAGHHQLRRPGAGRDGAAGRPRRRGPDRHARRAAGRPRRGPDDGAHRPRPGHGPGRDAARRGAAPGRHRRRGARPDGVLLGEGSRVVQVLAAQQWLATPVPLALEMLAAHVMPNHPAVTALVSEAAGVLEQKTGSGALVRATPTGPERVDEVVAAIAEAMQRRGIRYSEPPLSLVRPRPAGPHAGRRPHLAGGHPAGHRRRPRRRAGAGRHPAAAVAGRRARVPRLLARGAQRRERRDHRRRPAGQPGRPRADRPGRDDAAHRHRRARRRPAPPRLHRLADRRARPDPRRHRRPPRPQGRHLPAAGPGPRRGRRPAGRRVPAGAAQRPREARAAGARAVEQARGARRACSSGRTRCSTSACATG